MKGGSLVRWWWWLALAGAVGAGELHSALCSGGAYALESVLQLNDAARAEREVGYRVRGALHVAPVRAPGDDCLLHFRLISPKLYLRGKHMNADFMPYDSVWDSYSDTTFYALLSNGLIKKTYLDPNELPDVLNYKKSLLSLFQVQMLDGEHNETDVSGTCLVTYETITSEVFRKIKRSCAADAESGVESARRVARYTLGPAPGPRLHALHAEELLLLGPARLGLKARAWHSLARSPEAPRAGPAADPPPALRDLPLALAPPAAQPERAELAAALAGGAAALRGGGAGEGGDASVAAAALQLLPALRRANHSALLDLLHRDDMHDHLSGLCRLLGLAGSAAAHSAAAEFLQLHARDPLRLLAHDYLAAAAHAPRPHPAAARDLLRLAQSARDPGVRHHALLAAAAAAPAAARDAVLRALPACRDPPCRARLLRALANLRRADTADLLLEHAEAADADEALAALDALDAAPPGALTFARLDRLQALALSDHAALEVRAAALDLLVRRRASVPAPLAAVAHALYRRGPHELRRVLWQRMAALVERPALSELRALPALLEPQLRGWDAHAHAGTSTVLVREPGWAVGGWRAELQSVQVARAGLLRRGTVQLLAVDDQDNSFDALTVEVWTRGLEAFSGGSDTTEEKADNSQAEEAAGGLAFTVGGVRMRDVRLFSGQAELLGHVWAGTASEPTPVLRALRPLAELRAAVPLLLGVHAHVQADAALDLALDAQAQVSLWWRSARAELGLRAGLAAAAELHVRPAWGEVGARAAVRVEPRLRVAADLDFYSGVALCVRVTSEPHELHRTVELQSAQSARRLRVRRLRTASTRREGRTLALGRPNDATCRTLRAADATTDATTD